MQSARFPPSILLVLETWWRFADMEPTKDQSPPHSRPTSSFDGLLDLPEPANRQSESLLDAQPGADPITRRQDMIVGALIS